MSDQIYDDYGSGEAPSRFSRVKSVVSTAIGALVAMALLMALGIWFYRLGVRDAQNVPIIRAAAEPAKSRPEDPGGVVTPHQDVESYEVASSEPAQAGAAYIATPAPSPRPEDVAMGELDQGDTQPGTGTQAEAPETFVQSGQDTTGIETDESLPIVADLPLGDEEEQIALAPAQEQAVAETEAEVESEPEPEPVVANGSAFAPSISPLSSPRPANWRDRVEQAVVRDQQSETALAVRAAKSQVQIQLAANPDEGKIRALWQQVSRANSDLLRNRALAVQTTVSGGVTFYRLRVGPFKDGTEARAVCEALKSRGQDCIIARNS
jgi:hypothetical protein